MQFQGFIRKDERVGVRNAVLLLAVCGCGEPAARQMADGIPACWVLSRSSLSVDASSMRC